MIEINTKLSKPIQVNIDGTVYEVRKITNRVMLKCMELSESLQKIDISVKDATDMVADLLMLYLPLDRDWILDNLDMEECRRIAFGIMDEMHESIKGSEPPLASGPGGDNLPI